MNKKINGSHALIGASVPPSVEQLEVFKKLKLGDIVLTSLPNDKEEAKAVTSFCRKNKIHLVLSEMTKRGFKEKKHKNFSKADMDEIIAAAGEYYWGRYTIGEAGGIIYWPKEYVLNGRAGGFHELPSCETVDEAHKKYVDVLSELIEYERSEVGGGPLINVESSILFKYQEEAGIDVLCAELMPGDPVRILSALRGAARASGKNWGVHIAMGWYGGSRLDPIWKKRWKSALLYSHIAGADFMFPESGHYNYDFNECGEGVYDFHHEEMKDVRRTLREVWQFANINKRPGDGPKVSVGIVHGNHDGAPGLWNPYAWGQYHKGNEWPESCAEKSWELTDLLYQKPSRFKEYVNGATDFSGNPPEGQVDFVPAEAPLDHLMKYKCLVFLGWNTMTDEIYEKLKKYVESGGHLVMWLSHLNIEKNPQKEPQMHKNGDFSDLFGAKIENFATKDTWGVKFFKKSVIDGYQYPIWRINTDPRCFGWLTPAKVAVERANVVAGFADFYADTVDALESRPAIIENKVGKGMATLVCAKEYPGDEGAVKLAETLLWTIVDGEQGDLSVCAPDNVRYSVYDDQMDGREFRVIYLLNTDYDLSQNVRFRLNGKLSGEVSVPANELRVVYVLNSLIVTPETKNANLTFWSHENGHCKVGFHSPVKQAYDLFNMGDQSVTVSIGPKTFDLPSGGHKSVNVSKKQDAKKKYFYASDFLDEPEIEWDNVELPY